MEELESKGLGDTIAKITHATGLDKVADAVAKMAGKEDCGCGRRRQTLNELFPYTKENEVAKPDIYGELVGDEWLVFPWEEEEKIGNRDNTYGEL